MYTNTTTFKSLIASFLLVGIFFTGTPYVYAQGTVTDPGNTAINTAGTLSQVTNTSKAVMGKLKEFGLDKVAFAIAKRLMERLSQRVLNWANEGFEGNPFYVDDPGEFFKDLAAEEFELILTGARASDNPFIDTVVKTVDAGRDIEENGITIEQMLGENWERMYVDFDEGGWEGYSTLFSPENNVIGTQLMTSNKATAKINAGRSQTELDLLSNDGFITFRTCKETNIQTEFADRRVEVTWGDRASQRYTGLGKDFNPKNFKQKMTAYVLPENDGATPPPSAPGGGQSPTIIPPEPVPMPIIVACTQYETQTPGGAISNVIDEQIMTPIRNSENIDEFGEFMIGSLMNMAVGITQAGVRQLTTKANLALTQSQGPGDSTRNDRRPEDWAESPALSIDLDSELYGLYSIEDKYGNIMREPGDTFLDENDEQIAWPGEFYDENTNQPLALPYRTEPNFFEGPPAGEDRDGDGVGDGEILPDGTITETDIILPVIKIKEGALELSRIQTDLLIDIVNGHEQDTDGDGEPDPGTDRIEGLQQIPEKLWELDKCLPGPDGPGEAWIGRLRDFLRDEDRVYNKVKKKADKKDKEFWEDALVSVDYNLAVGVQQTQLAMTDPEKTIPSYQEIINMVNYVRTANSELSEYRSALLRANAVKGNLGSINNKWRNATSDFERAEARYAFSQIQEIPSEETIGELRTKKEEVLAVHDAIDALQDTCETEVAQKKAEDPRWAALYDGETVKLHIGDVRLPGQVFTGPRLFCAGEHPLKPDGTRDTYIVDNIRRDWTNEMDGNNRPRLEHLFLTCKSFYESNISDYIDSEYY